jgi:hypothetical protein
LAAALAGRAPLDELAVNAIGKTRRAIGKSRRPLGKTRWAIVFPADSGAKRGSNDNPGLPNDSSA